MKITHQVFVKLIGKQTLLLFIHILRQIEPDVPSYYSTLNALHFHSVYLVILYTPCDVKWELYSVSSRILQNCYEYVKKQF